MAQAPRAAAVLPLFASVCGVAVVVFGFRRQIDLARHLGARQAVLGVLSLLLIVLLPRPVELVVRRGRRGRGDLHHWTPAPTVNTVVPGALRLMDGLCLGFGTTLLRHPPVHHPPLRPRQHSRLNLTLGIQLAGVLLLLVQRALELLLSSVNNQEVLPVPVLLPVEDWLVMRSLAGL